MRPAGRLTALLLQRRLSCAAGPTWPTRTLSPTLRESPLAPPVCFSKLGKTVIEVLVDWLWLPQESLHQAHKDLEPHAA